MRLIIADDAPLIREALSRLLADQGMDVVATAATGDELVDAVLTHATEAVIADIRMPPTFTDEGIAAAHRVRASIPGLPVLLLSNHLELRYATQLLGDDAPIKIQEDFLKVLENVEDQFGSLEKAGLGAMRGIQTETLRAVNAAKLMSFEVGGFSGGAGP